jgi:subtilase family serine protease
MSHGRRRRYTAWIAALAIPAASTALTSAAQAAVPGSAGHAAGLHAAAPAGPQPVAGTKPGWAMSSAYRGAASGSAGISARIWLAGRDPAGLAAYDRQASTPGSPGYRHFLTPAQFRARFGATPAQRSAVVSWARSAGLTVTAATDHYVGVKTTVATAGRAFSVRFGEYSKNGTLTRAPESSASVPSAIAPAVLAITGLDSAAHQVRPTDALPNPPQNRWDAAPCSSYYGRATATGLPAAYGAPPPWVTCGYSPRQLRSAYGVTKSGLTGQGTTVAITMAYNSPTIVQDTNQYSTDNGEPALKAGQYTSNLPTSWNSVAACGGASAYTEQTLDVEAVHAIAPAANIVYVAASSCGDTDFEDALLRVVDNHLADIVSNSWAGTFDQEVSQIAIYDSIFQQGIAEGIGFYFGTGDYGYNDPATPGGSAVGSDKLQVNYPASSPYVTGVGGTALAIGAHDQYMFETSYGLWRDKLAPSGTSWINPLPGTYPGDFYQGGGGGISTQYNQPWYQSNVVPDSLSKALPDGTQSSTPMRAVPDIAMDADPFTGLNLGQTTQQPNGSYAYSRSRWAGTSLATPLFAGMQALAEQALGSPIGFANPEIYQRFQAGDIKPIQPSTTPVYYALHWYTAPFTQTPPILTYLVTAGVDGSGAASLPLRNGYSSATGVGAPNFTYLNHFQTCHAGACT